MKPFTHNRKQKGAFLVLFAVLLPVFLLLVALVSEIGRIWAYHTKLQNAADAAALAGAANFVNGDTIDSHPNADLFADRYVTANLGHNLASSPNLQQFQAKTKAATGSEGEKSYYRVHLEEEIPLIQATAAWLHRPTFLVKATAVALIGKEGKEPTPTSSSPLFSLRTGFDKASTANKNNQQTNPISATFDGDIVVSDYDYYEYYQVDHNTDEDHRFKFFPDEYRGKRFSDYDDPQYYKRIKYQSESEYEQKVDRYKTMMDKMIQDNFGKSNFWNIAMGNNARIPDPRLWIGKNIDYIYVHTGSQNMDIQLGNIPGDVNKPVLLYIDSNYTQVQINIVENSIRPVIICYLGETHYTYHNQWWTEMDRQFKIYGNGKTFNGMLFTPYAYNFMSFDASNSNFTGTVFADKLDLRANNGQFTIKDYFGDGGGSSGGGGGSGTPAVKPRLVDNSLW